MSFFFTFQSQPKGLSKNTGKKHLKRDICGQLKTSYRQNYIYELLNFVYLLFYTAWRLLRSLHECSSISISNVYNVNHISHVTTTFVWLSNRKSVFKIDHSGRVLHKFRIDDIWGSASHTIDQSGNCLLIRNDKVLRCKSNEEEETLIAPDWTVLSIYSSKLNGDILLGIYILIEKGSRTKLARYTRDGGVISELE